MGTGIPVTLFVVAMAFAVAGYVAAKYSDRDFLLNGVLATALITAWNVYDLVRHHITQFDSIGGAIVSWRAPLLALAGAALRSKQLAMAD